jgi:predicted nucleic acid-binding protein
LCYVFDTNVLISALLLPDSTSRHALDMALRKGTVLISFAALAELREVLSRSHDEFVFQFVVGSEFVREKPTARKALAVATRSVGL